MVPWKKAAAVLGSIFSFAWLLNFAWEIIHAPFLYQIEAYMGIETLEQFVAAISYVAVEDALLILLMYGIVATVARDLFWIKDLEQIHVSTMALAGFVIAVGIEYRALYVSDKWAYTAAMPTVFGLGLSPLLQLAVTGLVSLFLAQQILYGQPVYGEKKCACIELWRNCWENLKEKLGLFS